MNVIDKVKNKIILAPLAGYTDAGFRKICADFGCGITVTEMVSAMALKHKNRKTFQLLKEKASTKNPLRCVQLFGRDEKVFAEIVKMDEVQRFDVIDLNMGCPVPKVVKNGEGSFLMKDTVQAAKVIEATVVNSNKPVSVKFRNGYQENSAPEFAKICEESGASFLTIHGRLATQMYHGNADLSCIREAVENVKIPIFANGDIKSKEDVDKAIKTTGAAGVAIGRGALGRPWLFEELLEKKVSSDVSLIVQEHVEILSEIYSERIVLNEMKKHLAWYFKGMHDAKSAISELFLAKSVLDLIKKVKAFCV